MQRNVPFTRDLVLVGGGHTHALVLRRWGMRPVPGARLTLIHPAPTAPYSGMLPGHIAGHYARHDLEIDIVRLARFAGARLVVGTATAIDPATQQVTVTDRGAIGYDILSLDIGVTSEMPNIPGFAEHALPAKPLDRLATGWARFADTASDGAKVIIIGGGVAGAELAMAAKHRLRGVSGEVTLVERGTALTALPDRASGALRQALGAAGVSLIEGVGLAEVTESGIHLSDGRRMQADCVIGAAGARPHDWVAKTGLQTEDGYLVVDDQLRSVSDERIYASGDCAHLPHAPRPKAGVFAVRAAPILTHNLRADLTGGRRRVFKPQRDYLKLISLGRKAALGEKSGRLVQGDWVWRWKDRIDRNFMRKLSDLPKMPEPPLHDHAALDVAEEMAGPAPCGGCGAKLGANVLAGTLAGMKHGGRTDVELGAGDDAAVLKIGGARLVVSTDHLRGFSEDAGLVARVAALHAMGDIWAMGAKPQAALAQITLPQMTERLQTRTMAEVMEAAVEVFAAEGAEIVGGHSTQGAELQIGFTVTGLLDGKAITSGGAKRGDVLILTRPIGSGVILAADMAGKAPGQAVTQLWKTMAEPQGKVAAILAKSANAMTDVTGFGFAGHLWEICDNSGIGAEVDLAKLPLFEGAQTLAENGITSSLAPKNEAALAGKVVGADGSKRAMLFDPQTAGGMLAAVPAIKADEVLSALSEAGQFGVRVGQMVEGAPEIRLL